MITKLFKLLFRMLGKILSVLSNKNIAPVVKM